MFERGRRVLNFVVAYFLIGVVVAWMALGFTERDLSDPQMLIMGAYFALMWPILLILLIFGFRK
jgi:hypothetical protein